MKKNMLFSIALCIGLMLPGISFGSEPTQSTADWIMEKINSWYNSPQAQAPSEQENNVQQNQNYAILAALVMGGLGYLALSQKNSKYKNKKTDLIQAQTALQARIATEVYGMLPVDLTNAYGDNNIKNIATFLSNEEWGWEAFQNLQDNPDAQWDAQIAEVRTPGYVFNNYVLPVLNQLIPTLPNQPQALIDYNNSNLDTRIKSLDQVQNRTDVTDYYTNTSNFWNNFINTIKPGGIKRASADNEKYLIAIKKYLQSGTPLETSIEDALSGQLGKSYRIAF